GEEQRSAEVVAAVVRAHVLDQTLLQPAGGGVLLVVERNRRRPRLQNFVEGETLAPRRQRQTGQLVRARLARQRCAVIVGRINRTGDAVLGVGDEDLRLFSSVR